MAESLTHQPPLPLTRDSSTVVKLCIMMFLQFFVWGAWYVTVGNYMSAQGIGKLIPWAYSVSPIAAIIAPLFVGIVADRFFATERILAFMHLVGAVAVGLAPFAARQSGSLFIVALLVHMLCYMPTINLTNTIAFRNLSNQEKQFPKVRVWGTIGWIVANFTVGAIGATDNSRQFYLTAIVAVVLALFSLGLPHTPPPAKGKQASARELLGLDALSMLRERPYFVFMVCSLLISIPLAVYYSYSGTFIQAAGDAHSIKTPAILYDASGVIKVPWLTLLGQIAEAGCMLLVPMLFARIGVKWILAMGMAAWVVRYFLFAAASTSAALPLIILGVVLHGICYDFFFVTAFIYADKKASNTIRGQAQGLLVLATYGLGMLIGAQVGGAVFNNVVTVSPTSAAALPGYQRFWVYPAVFAAAILLAFVALFKDDARGETATAPTVDPAQSAAPA